MKKPQALFDIDCTADPPRVRVLMVGPPMRYASFEIERHDTRLETQAAVVGEIARTPRELFDLMAWTTTAPDASRLRRQ